MSFIWYDGPESARRPSPYPRRAAAGRWHYPRLRVRMLLLAIALAVAPQAADTLRWVVTMAGRPAGTHTVWTDPYGLRHATYEHNDSGRGPAARGGHTARTRASPPDGHHFRQRLLQVPGFGAPLPGCVRTVLGERCGARQAQPVPMISKWLSTARRRRWRCSRARSSRRLTNGCRCCLRVRRIARVGTRTVMGAPLRHSLSVVVEPG
jgi:hypothetical protein